ncbi:RNA dependent RNA polymerase-domain-containing protein [Dichotomocladium elegans]|nr:RNA dependent RNA polymerase-domain-containing protein [Dichotomocladium elegans]
MVPIMTDPNVTTAQNQEHSYAPRPIEARRGGSRHSTVSSPQIFDSRNRREVMDNCDPCCILISNLNRKTVAGSLHDFFSRFGDVDRIEIDLDIAQVPKGSAIVLFSAPPADISFVFDEHRMIDGSRVRMQFAPKGFADTHQWRETRPQSDSYKIQVAQLSLGIMEGPKSFMSMWSISENIQLSFDYDTRYIAVFFDHLDGKYRMGFSFEELREMIQVERDKQAVHLTMTLRYPGRVWQRRKTIQTPCDRTVDRDVRSSTRQTWVRVTDIPLNKTAEKELSMASDKKRVPMLPVAPLHRVDMGRWLTLRATIHPLEKYGRLLYMMLTKASEYNLVPHDFHQVGEPILRVFSGSSINTLRDHIYRAKTISNYNVLYILECALSNHCIEEVNLDDDFYSMINALNPDVASDLLNILFEKKTRIWEPTEFIINAFKRKPSKIGCQLVIPEHCVPIRKIMISPTSMYFQPPTIELTNRVVRQFHEYSDRFLRVQFVDDGLRRIQPSFSEDNNDAIYNRIFKVLHNGIQVGPRRYEFLAFSSSQLREHGCWFFAPTESLSVKEIRNWMGDFSDIKTIAKNATRMGQCFTTTIPTLHLDEKQVEVIDDIENNGYVFSDGVGKISPGLARDVAQLLKVDYTPSAFQFRLGGAKGVLSISNYLNGKMVQLRPSQIKFQSRQTMLEIVRVSRYLPAYLNRQAIILLSSRGIKDMVFMQKTNSMIETLNLMLSNSATAIKLIMQNADEFGTAREMVDIISQGFLERRDPYITNLIKIFRVNRLNDLKEKTRIHVPNGALLLGILDETNTLEEDEIFCQVSEFLPNSTYVKRNVVVGECVIFRNPCLYPGDIRVVKAVDTPKLRHLYDVIVFSAKGHRDLPSMLSGGDLDGDDYTLIWDPALIPTKENYSPMNYKSAHLVEVDKVKISHIQKFFVNYINNDNLGQIANAHLAIADMSPMGVLDGRCLRLAQLHSQAVDFSKTGRPAVFDQDLSARVFPDFMEKKNKPSYKSEKVLGRIFRSIEPDVYENYQDKLLKLSDTTYDVRLWMPDMAQFILEARALRDQYSRDILSLMNQYGISTEIELLSGYVIERTKKNSVHKSTYEVNKQMMRSVSRLREYYRKELEKDFVCNGIQKRDASKQTLLETKAAAWYYVTYHPEERKRARSDDDDLVSFPWTGYTYLCELARRNNHRQVTPVMYQPIDDVEINSFRMLHITLEDGGDENEDYYDEDDEGSGFNVNEEEDINIDVDYQPPVIDIKLSSLTKSISTSSDHAQQASPKIPPSITQDYVVVGSGQTDEELIRELIS